LMAKSLFNAQFGSSQVVASRVKGQRCKGAKLMEASWYGEACSAAVNMFWHSIPGVGTAEMHRSGGGTKVQIRSLELAGSLCNRSEDMCTFCLMVLACRLLMVLARRLRLAPSMALMTLFLFGDHCICQRRSRLQLAVSRWNVTGP
jgi:hypothetical protein